MLKEYKNKEVERWSKLLASYESDVKDLNEQIGAVEEKYRKLAEEETANLTEAVEYYKSMAEDCKAKLAVLGEEPKEEEKPKARKKKVDSNPTPDPEPEQTKVVDTLFPKNNEPELEVTEEITEEQVEEAPEETTLKQEIEELWPDEKPAEDAKPESGDIDLDTWPEDPEEWK